MVFAKALRWFDRADELTALAEQADGKAMVSTLRMATQASDCGLKFRRTLRFTSAEAAGRRPGRPSGEAALGISPTHGAALVAGEGVPCRLRRRRRATCR